MTDPDDMLQRSLPAAATAPVVGGIRAASAATKVDFTLLMAEAEQESGFRADAKASTGSATGLFQFIGATWLGLVQRFGDKYGIGGLARQVSTDASGQPAVADPMARQRILDLRKDPKLSAALAAEQTRLNQRALEQALGRPAGNAELYMAHFLGAAGAATFLKAAESGGSAPAAALLPKAAAANPNVFFDASGRARSLAEIYRGFAERIDSEALRFAKARPASAGAAAGPAFIGSLGFSATRLSPPLATLLNVFTLGAPPPASPGPAPHHPAARRSA